MTVFVEGKIALNHVLEMIEAWMKNNLMEINYKKCGIFKLHSNDRETLPAKRWAKSLTDFLRLIAINIWAYNSIKSYSQYNT